MTKERFGVQTFFNYGLNHSYLHSKVGPQGADSKKTKVKVFIFGSRATSKVSSSQLPMDFLKSLSLADWQLAEANVRTDEFMCLHSQDGPVWILRPALLQAKVRLDHKSTPTLYAAFRDVVGRFCNENRDQFFSKSFEFIAMNLTEDEARGALVGIELASYRFTSVMKAVSSSTKSLKEPSKSVDITLKGFAKTTIDESQKLAFATNMSRHLVNLDAKTLNPKTYAEEVQRWFSQFKNVDVDVWDEKKILRDGMTLLAGVGQGAEEKSRMVHIRYRPSGNSRSVDPLIVVGKGITFDSGGLDIKPPSAMRLMKKDMGGSASVVGMAQWVISSGQDMPCEFYLALAENAVDSRSMRPGDVFKSRRGLTVEIHNTDAEGRLVLADVLDYALELASKRKESPRAILDFATLTGAMRVALGAEIAGYFSNDDKLATSFQSAANASGDPAWRLPLWQSYRSQLKSSFADMANASDSGFAGAITAALFLEKFVDQKVPWLHVDLYCWTDRSVGALGDVGGNGQGVQLFAEFVRDLRQTNSKARKQKK